MIEKLFFSDQILTVKFMRKYIHIARCMKPKLSEEACKRIADEYARLRSEDNIESDVARVRQFIFFLLFFIKK
jgi:DNA replication licensing factor MCM3